MEGKEIALSDWARKNGIDPSTARHKALKGNFDTARKVGRDWLINENEPNIDRRRKQMEIKSRKYFKNLDVEKEDIVLEKLELIFPENFKKKLNSMEKTQLLNDQLLDFGLQTGDYIMGSVKIVPANKGAQHIEEDTQISKRLREYLEKINNM